MRIGIVVPAFDAAPWIGDAIASVIAQSHRDWVLVVVDDGSTDATASVAAGFADPRIDLVRQVNAGVSAARNRGVAALFGGERGVEALLFLDADDWLAPDALSRLITALDGAPEAVAAAGAYRFAHTTRVRAAPSRDILERLLVRNLFANGGHLLIRATVVRAMGGFRTDIAYGEDWEFWIRLALQGGFVAVMGKSPVLCVRQHAGGAYQRCAADPSAFGPCMDAIFGNPALQARFDAGRLAAIHRRAEAENAWIIGREMIRHDKAAEGRAWLRRSVRGSPSAKRVALLAAACAIGLVPAGLRGPFRSYRGVSGS